MNLQSLLGGFPAEKFLAEHWPERPLHLRGDRETLLETIGVPALRDFPTLMKEWKHEALVLPMNGGDESQGVTATGPAIARLYEDGRPMFLHRPERQFAPLRKALRALRDELGIPLTSKFLCSTHASPGRTSTNLHFDDAISFIFQLHGKKTWWLAPNHHFPDPTLRYSVTMPAVDGAMLPYVNGELPRTMPADATKVELEAGSILFVPSGYWHATESDEPSLALMFVLIHRSWADVIATQVRRELAKDPAFRRFAVGATTHHAGQRARGEEMLVALLRELPSKLASLSTDLLEPRYLREPLTAARFEGDRLLVGPELSLMLGAEERAIFEAIGGNTSHAELCAAGHDPDLVGPVLDALVDARYLRVG